MCILDDDDDGLIGDDLIGDDLIGDGLISDYVVTQVIITIGGMNRIQTIINQKDYCLLHYHIY